MDKLTIYKVQQLSHWMDDPSGELEKIDMSLDEVDRLNAWMDDVEGGFYIKAGQLPEEKVFQLMTCLRNAAEVIDKEAEVLRESRR